MTIITSPWPFAQWGIDIVGPLPQGKKQVKFLLVAIDNFTKWVEVEALTTITEAKVQGFVWKNIICRFDILRTIISDNDRQFDDQAFKSFCLGLRIKNHFSSLGHPQANGQTEMTNRTLLKAIKVRLEGAKGAWHKELPSILWAYGTMTRTPKGETLFNLTYGMEVVILVEVGVTIIKGEFFNEETNNEQLRTNLDCLDKIRDDASRRMARYQQKMSSYYNQRVKLRRFNIRDLLLRKVMPATKNPAHGKLGPTWEGPYKVTHYSRQGSYQLESLDGKSYLVLGMLNT